jgi:hypothetical protein
LFGALKDRKVPRNSFNKIARDMLVEAKDVVYRRESGASFTITTPREHHDVNSNDLMFSLMVIAPEFGLDVESHNSHTFNLVKL